MESRPEIRQQDYNNSFPQGKGYNGGRYSLTFLGSENSDRAKDTWALLTASTQFMRKQAMNVYIKTKRRQIPPVI
jgi:hypothetical protein